MFALLADFDPLTAWVDDINERCRLVELIAHLVEVSNLQVAASMNLAALGWQFTEDDF